MANAYTDTSNVSNLVVTAYDLYVHDYLRDNAIFRQFVDTRPTRQAHPGSSVVFSIDKGFANLATTALTENVTPDSVAIQNPSRVTVTLNEYGMWSQISYKLHELGFVTVDPIVAQDIGKNMVDSIDYKVRTTMDTADRHVAMIGTTITPSAGGDSDAASVTSSSVISGKFVAAAVTKLRGELAPTWDGDTYAMVLHPDVAYDLRSDTSNTGWLYPAAYSDANRIWRGEVGMFAGARIVESARCTTATDGASSAKVYRGYAIGKEAVAEAVSTTGEPGVVLGPVTDPLLRERPIGWKALMGWSLFRPQSLRLLLTASSLPADA